MKKKKVTWFTKEESFTENLHFSAISISFHIHIQEQLGKPFRLTSGKYMISLSIYSVLKICVTLPS